MGRPSFGANSIARQCHSWHQHKSEHVVQGERQDHLRHLHHVCGPILYSGWECCTYSSDGDSRGRITTLIAYTAMFFASLIWGNRNYKVPYNWSKIGGLVVVSSGLAFALHYFPLADISLKIGLGLTYLFVMFMVERNGLFKFVFRK